MISKAIIFVSLCAFAFATVTYEPPDYPCLYHLSYPWFDEEKGVDTIIDEYGMVNNETFFYFETGTNAANGERTYHLVIRGDMPVGNKFYSVVFDDGDDPHCSNTTSTRYPNSPFDFKTKEIVDCPDGTKGCTKLINEDGNFVIINAAGRYVVDPDGFNITWHNDVPTLDMFAFEDCDGTEYPAPKAVCTSYYGVFNPVKPDCLYHMTYPYVKNGTKMLVHEYGMVNDDSFYYLERVYDAVNTSKMYLYSVIRGDVPYENMSLRIDYTVEDGQPINCSVRASGRLPNDPFIYIEKPEEVLCPNGTEGCLKLTNITGGSVIVKGERYIIDPQGWNFTYLDDVPTMDMFIAFSCDTKTKYDAPKNVCVSPSSSHAPVPPTSSSHAPVPPPTSSSHSPSSASSITVSICVMILALTILLL